MAASDSKVVTRLIPKEFQLSEKRLKAIEDSPELELHLNRLLDVIQHLQNNPLLLNQLSYSFREYKYSEIPFLDKDAEIKFKQNLDELTTLKAVDFKDADYIKIKNIYDAINNHIDKVDVTEDQLILLSFLVSKHVPKSYFVRTIETTVSMTRILYDSAAKTKRRDLLKSTNFQEILLNIMKDEGYAEHLINALDNDLRPNSVEISKKVNETELMRKKGKANPSKFHGRVKYLSKLFKKALIGKPRRDKKALNLYLETFIGLFMNFPLTFAAIDTGQLKLSDAMLEKFQLDIEVYSAVEEEEVISTDIEMLDFISGIELAVSREEAMLAIEKYVFFQGIGTAAVSDILNIMELFYFNIPIPLNERNLLNKVLDTSNSYLGSLKKTADEIIKSNAPNPVSLSRPYRYQLTKAEVGQSSPTKRRKKTKGDRLNIAVDEQVLRGNKAEELTLSLNAEVLAGEVYTFKMLRDMTGKIQQIEFEQQVLDFFSKYKNERIKSFKQALLMGYVSRKGPGVKHLGKSMHLNKEVYQIKPGKSSFRIMLHKDGHEWIAYTVLHKDNVQGHLDSL